jgi:hypothetical protein
VLAKYLAKHLAKEVPHQYLAKRCALHPRCTFVVTKKGSV